MKGIIIILLLFCLSSSHIVTKNELKRNFTNSLNESNLRIAIFFILYINNGNPNISIEQSSSILEWNYIKDQFMTLMLNFINIYYDFAPFGKNASKIDNKSHQKLLELIFNFVFNLYNENKSIYPLPKTILAEYFTKIGNKLVYPNWTSIDEFYDLISSYHLMYDRTFEDIHFFIPNHAFMTI